MTSRHLDLADLEQILKTGHRMIVFSHIETDEIILKCLDLGAASYIAKSEGKDHLTDAISAAGHDIPYVAPSDGRRYGQRPRFGRPKSSGTEKEVLIAWFQTDSKDFVADKLPISPSTVRTHLQRVRAKYAAVVARQRPRPRWSREHFRMGSSTSTSCSHA